jgi:uncharacterized surface protein with fasciclin (FAS1) repeats
VLILFAIRQIHPVGAVKINKYTSDLFILSSRLLPRVLCSTKKEIRMKFRSLLNLTAFSAALVVSAASYASAKADIVDTAVAAGSFNTLVTAVKAADLVDTLKGAGPFTVFAPNDAAFAKVPAADLQALLKDKAALGNVLTYHVVAGKVMAADVVKLTSAKTVQGQELKIEVKDGVVHVDGAKVITADIETSNGVIHVIDSVVLPK